MTDQPTTGQERPARLSEDEHEQMVEVHIDWCGTDQETTTERPICRYCWHEGADGEPRHQDWPCEVVRLRSERDAWKARAEPQPPAAPTTADQAGAALVEAGDATAAAIHEGVREMPRGGATGGGWPNDPGRQMREARDAWRRARGLDGEGAGQ